uniref:Putative secreted protein n=1 Tax=Anopheles darlingi TaxID=43151 RepID=A0A2M4D5V8_ANODA
MDLPSSRYSAAAAALLSCRSWLGSMAALCGDPDVRTLRPRLVRLVFVSSWPSMMSRHPKISSTIELVERRNNIFSSEERPCAAITRITRVVTTTTDPASTMLLTPLVWAPRNMT